MENLDFSKYATPYKLGRPVITPSGVPGTFNSHGIDCPFVFYHNGRYYMSYVGFDGQGYQTALSVSDNLIDWEFYGLVLAREPGEGWDHISPAGTWILKESNGLYDVPVLRKHNNRYWMIYHAYPGAGFETGPAEMGLAWCEDEDLLTWHKLEQPVLSWKDGGEWESAGLYKAALIAHEDKFYLFYNAKNKPTKWIEQTGVAVSDDLLHWERPDGNPILEVSPGKWDSHFVSDPAIYQDGELWLNFFFGFNNVNAQDGLAYSDNLLTGWRKLEEPIIRAGAPGELDCTHAHKASIVYANGTLYHFYCAVRPIQDGDISAGVTHEYRTITVATSNPLE